MLAVADGVSDRSRPGLRTGRLYDPSHHTRITSKHAPPGEPTRIDCYGCMSTAGYRLATKNPRAVALVQPEAPKKLRVT